MNSNWMPTTTMTSKVRTGQTNSMTPSTRLDNPLNATSHQGPIAPLVSSAISDPGFAASPHAHIS